MNNIGTMTRIIGTEDKPFFGHFNGNNFTITLDLNYPNEIHVALFSWILGKARIINLTVAGSVAGLARVGGIAGGAAWSEISNCINLAEIICQTEIIFIPIGTSFVGQVGGIVG